MTSVESAEVIARLQAILELLQEQQLTRKRVLTIEEAAKYIGLSPSYIHKLSSKGQIPCSKPHGKTLYFDRVQLEEWLLKNPKTMQEDNERAAADFNFRRK